jgi:hypothetical protein
VAIRRVVVADLDLELADVELVRPPVDLGGHRPEEVLLVTADEEQLAEAGVLGVHRLLPGEDAGATAAAIVELVDLLTRA